MGYQLKYGLLFISPAIAAFLLFWIFPFSLALYYSVNDWPVGGVPTFVGLENYLDLFGDPNFRRSVWASVKVTGLSLAAVMVLALGLALLLDDDRLRGKRIFRAMIILPVVADWVATGLVWQLMFLPHQGVLAELFRVVGLIEWMGLPWTSSRRLAPVALAIFITWKSVGLYAVIYLAGIKSIPEQFMEAALVDGASPIQAFRRVTLPLMRPITIFVLVHALVTIVGLFEPIFILTGGGPADATRTLPIFLFEVFFQFQQGGYASAAAILFLAGTLLLALVAALRLRYSFYE